MPTSCCDFDDTRLARARSRRCRRNWIGRSEGARGRLPHSRHGATPRVRVFTTRPDTLWGATFMVLAPEHPLVDADHDARAARRRRRTTVEQAARQTRDRAHQRRAREDRRLHRRLCHQPGQRRAHPDLDRRLRPDRATAPARSWPCRRTTSATSSSPRSIGLPIIAVVISSPMARRPSRWTAAYHRGDGMMVNSGPFNGIAQHARRSRKVDRLAGGAGLAASARSTTACATG